MAQFFGGFPGMGGFPGHGHPGAEESDDVCKHKHTQNFM